MSFDDFKNASGDEPDDGLHSAVLQEASTFESSNGNRLIKTCWWTADRAHYWESLHGVEGAGKRFTHELLAALDIDLSKLSGWDELGTELALREGQLYEVEVSRRGTFLNTSIEGRLQGVQDTLPDVPIDNGDLPKGDGPPPVAATATPEDEDIPF
jgi:hypothetical protein